jgi:hypothetical protein
LKHGAGYGYTRLLGYHPLLATRADTREALHTRLRKGSANHQRGIERFSDELIAHVTRAGATSVKLFRADSGFWNTRVFKRLDQAGWQYSIGVRMIKSVREAVEAIDEDAWTSLADYPADREAQIAETSHDGRRLIVRRTRLIRAQAELRPDWRHCCFLTNRNQELALVEAEHRDHAVVEQVIANLKHQALAHSPRAVQRQRGLDWLAALARNMLRWTQRLGLPATPARAARTLRRWLLNAPRQPDPPRPRMDTAPASPAGAGTATTPAAGASVRPPAPAIA